MLTSSGLTHSDSEVLHSMVTASHWWSDGTGSTIRLKEHKFDPHQMGLVLDFPQKYPILVGGSERP